MADSETERTRKRRMTPIFERRGDPRRRTRECGGCGFRVWNRACNLWAASARDGGCSHGCGSGASSAPVGATSRGTVASARWPWLARACVRILASSRRCVVCCGRPIAQAVRGLAVAVETAAALDATSVRSQRADGKRMPRTAAATKGRAASVGGCERIGFGIVVAGWSATAKERDGVLLQTSWQSVLCVVGGGVVVENKFFFLPQKIFIYLCRRRIVFFFFAKPKKKKKKKCWSSLGCAKKKNHGPSPTDVVFITKKKNKL
jgi:hypothetical protein